MNIHIFKKGIQKRIGRILGHRTYDKCIILARSRTGSTLLLSYLNCHPRIYIGGEEFAVLGSKNWKKVWDTFFCRYPFSARWVGFKIFYYHPRDKACEDLWNYLQKDKSIHIIHLVRKNRLRSIVSKEVGLKQGVWTSIDAKKQKQKIAKKVFLDPHKCVEYLEQSEKWEKQARSQFADHPLIEITYEDLVLNKQKTLNSVFTFLGLSPKPVRTELKKQNPEKLRDLVENYDDLVKILKAEGFGHFVTDD
ncbi:MAG: Stf0 family sulfotransferase [Candidatus Woesearchaeota archaeon]